MSRQSFLSFKYNMAWGFIPVLVSMILSELATLGTAIYAGALLGIVLSAYTFLRKGSHLPQILLYGITAMLVLLAFTYYFYAASCQPQWYSFTLEVGTLLLILLFYLNRKSLKAYYGSSKRKHQSSAQSVEATKGSISRRLKALKPLSYRPVSYYFSALFICSPYCWQALPFSKANQVSFYIT